MQNLINSDNKILTNSETSKKECECDNALQLTSLSEEELQKWEIEKSRYYEICEYLKEVDDILDLIKPFPRDKNILENVETQDPSAIRTDVKGQSSESGGNHLENIIKLVDKLKELQDKSNKQRGRSYFGRDLKKLREHKKKLKSERLKQIISEESKRQFIADLPIELEKEHQDLLSPKSKPGSEDFFHPEKLECLSQEVGENKTKISKWTKVKEAFHWEKAIHLSATKPNKKLKSFQERNDTGSKQEYYDAQLPVQVWVFDDDSCPLPPPPPSPPSPLPRLRSLPSSKNEDCLLAPPLQDFPSSSSSDRLDDFVFTDSSKKGSKSPDADSTGQFFATDDNDDCGNGTRKSSSEEFITQISQKLSKDEFASSFSKSNKTTWGKVKDIIQTRKESLKKRPKKKISNNINQRRKLSSPPAIHFSHQIEDLSSPDEKLKNSEETIYSKGIQEPFSEIMSFANEESPKKPMPLLTITLPSSEETKLLSCETFETITKEDEKPNVSPSFSCQAQYCEEKPKYIKNKSVQNQKLSRWVKVKRVFLTSSSPPRTTLDELGAEVSPTGLHKFGFFSDLESDELSSGEWNEENIACEKGKTTVQQLRLSILQDDIRKSYEELQKKLSQEFDQKIREWDAKDEAIGKMDELFNKSLIEDKIATPKFKKSSVVPLPSLNDLSPEFRKKLNDWKKIKSTQGCISSSPVKEDVPGLNSKIRIGEWQPWKSRYSVKHIGKCEQSSFDETRKSEIKNSNLCPLVGQGKDEVGLAWRDIKGKEHIRKISNTRSVADTAINWNSNEAKSPKRVAKVKDFQWVEKELQKIVREKMRLEQEREKYLEREARLRQMKRTMGPAFPAQEILVKTPTGLIRFKGISQKFTKKLYEWEKARGIAPEASTFALLEERAITNTSNTSDGDVILQRSKSMGSIADLSTALLVPGVTHYPSSLSLNDVDELKTLDEDVLEESLSSDHFRVDSDKQPEALLVEVEDVVEEAEIETDFPAIKGEIPEYTFASEEFHRLATTDEGPSSPIYYGSAEPKSIDSTKRILKSAERQISYQRDNVDKVVEWMEQMNKSSEIRNVTTQLTSSRNKDPALSETSVRNEFLKKREIKNTQSKESVILQTTPVFFSVLENTTESKKPADEVVRTERVVNKTTPKAGAVEKEKIQSPELENIPQNQKGKSDPETIKQKIKEKITLMQRMSTDVNFNSNWKCERSREILDEKAGSTKNESSEGCEGSNAKFSSNEHNKSVSKGEATNINSVNVFVPTVRKIYSPVKANHGLPPIVCSYVVDDDQTPEASQINKCNSSENDKSCKSNFNQGIISNNEREKCTSKENKKFADETESESVIVGIPPLPNSPKLYKKLNAKETAPSIKIIIDKYNQKISEKEWSSDGKNDGGTVVGWKSPVFGRRTTEKVQKYFEKGDAFAMENNEVQKSASFDAVKSIPLSSSPGTLANENSQEKKFFKSNSVGIIKLPSPAPDSHGEDLKQSNEPEAANLEGSLSTLRAIKIKKAKEDFLSGRFSASSDASSTPSASTKYSADVVAGKPTKFSTSVDASSDNNLIKSISAETITSEQTPSQSDDQSFSGKNLQKSSSKFDLSSIKAKFRRMRWRRDKDSKLNSVATLCRQSLLIEVPSNSEANANLSKSCPSSPVMARNKQNGEDPSSKKNEK